MKITKAVIPAAGLGTRVLPATKAMPKEMLPIVDKPAIQYIVEEAVAAGITDILIITNRGKGVIEDHFDRSQELEETLEKANKTLQLDSIKDIHKLANIQFIRQIETKGLGHAVSKARTFVGDDPFLVLYGDDVILGDIPASKELIDAYGTFGKGVIGIKPVSEEAIKKYSSMKIEKIKDNIYKCTDMVEKPQTKEEMFSLYSILGRVVLPPEIFDILDHTAPGAGGAGRRLAGGTLPAPARRIAGFPTRADPLAQHVLPTGGRDPRDELPGRGHPRVGLQAHLRPLCAR